MIVIVIAYWLYGKFSGGGSSKHPCSETYAGARAFSEMETRNLAQFISGVARKIHVYLALHSYGQKFLIPYGHTTHHLSDYEYLVQVQIN